MTCAEAEPLLDAYFDDELDIPGALVLEAHVSRCHSCSARCRNLGRLREEIMGADLDLASTAQLERLRISIRRRSDVHSGNGVKSSTAWSRLRRTPWLVAAAAAAAVLLALFLPSHLLPRNDAADREVVDSHVRSLMAGHLVEVPSSDRHTVKPWFQGKLAFSPQVPDLTNEHFALLGGRLDVIGGHPAAALVYKRRNHIINLWTFPAGPGEQPPKLSEVDGYHVIQWRQANTNYWAVSDLNAGELREFSNAVRALSAAGN